ncbi:MAG: hypothetical protein HQ492_09550 [Woeseiaceae bacterium]|nr:hypothetical protein [Woeseiaceae bacterium]
MLERTLQRMAPNLNNLSTYIHSGATTEDQQFLIVNDELDESSGQRSNTTLRIYSLADLTNLTLAQEWSGPTAAVDHNGFVRGNRQHLTGGWQRITGLADFDAVEFYAYQATR